MTESKGVQSQSERLAEQEEEVEEKGGKRAGLDYKQRGQSKGEAAEGAWRAIPALTSNKVTRAPHRGNRDQGSKSSGRPFSLAFFFFSLLTAVKLSGLFSGVNGEDRHSLGSICCHAFRSSFR